MKRPAIFILLFLICGITLGSLSHLGFIHGGGYLLHILGIGLLFVVSALLYRHYKYWPVFIFVVFAALGLWRVNSSLYSHITTPTQATITGVAREVGLTGAGNTRVLMCSQYGFHIMAYIRPYMPQPVLGQQLTITGTLLPLSRPTNPGGFNQFQHMRSQGVDATIWPQTVALGETRTTLTVVLRRFRTSLEDVYHQVLPPQEAGVVTALVLGDRTHLDQNLRDQYRSMGIFHVLSISGLHIGIMMVALGGVLEKVLSQRKAGVVTIVVMVLFCILTGASTSTVRAVTMGGTYIFGKILHRKYDLLTAVSWAGVGLLLFEPLFLFNVGFQLSFVAVFGIGVLSAPLVRLLTKLRFPKWGRQGFAVGLSVTLATYPVFAYHFYEIATYSKLGNMLIASTTVIIVLGALLTGLLGLVFMPAAEVLAGVVYYILRFYDIASWFFARLPHAMLLTGGGNLLVAGLSALVLITFAWAFNSHGQAFRKRCLLLVVAVILLGLGYVTWRHPLGVHVTALDTPGNYVVVRHRGDVIIIGSLTGGEDVVLRYLDRHGVRQGGGVYVIGDPSQGESWRGNAFYGRVTNIYDWPRTDEPIFLSPRVLRDGRDTFLVPAHHYLVFIGDTFYDHRTLGNRSYIGVTSENVYHRRHIYPISEGAVRIHGHRFGTRVRQQ